MGEARPVSDGRSARERVIKFDSELSGPRLFVTLESRLFDKTDASEDDRQVD